MYVKMFTYDYVFIKFENIIFSVKIIACKEIIGIIEILLIYMLIV